jgi:hypothetical protein
MVANMNEDGTPNYNLCPPKLKNMGSNNTMGLTEKFDKYKSLKLVFLKILCDGIIFLVI